MAPRLVCVLLLAFVLPALAGPPAAAAPGPVHIVGGVGRCTPHRGALVAVSFAHWDGPAVRGCDPTPTTGAALLHAAGFGTGTDPRTGPGFIARIGHPRFRDGTRYPRHISSAAYWSYWLAPRGSNRWHYSAHGAYDDHPAAGEVEAWIYSAGSQPPHFTPNRIRGA